MDRLEVTLEDHGWKIKALEDMVVVVESKGGDGVDTLAIKADIDVLKKEVATLKSTDISLL